MNETITRINGNGQPYTTDLPLLVIITGHGNEWNQTGLKQIKENTGLTFERIAWGYTAQPTSSQQIAALLMTYNFKTRYYNNGSNPNQLHLKSDHHTGFDVDRICFDCCKANHIHAGNMTPEDRLSC